VTDNWSHEPGEAPPVTEPTPLSMPPQSGGWSPPNPPPPHDLAQPAPRPRGRRIVAGAVVLTLLLVAGFAVGRLTSDDAVDSTATDALASGVTPVVGSPPVESGVDEPVAAVAEAVSPAVVQIETGVGLGSGVVFSEDGLVLTNAHVVGDSSEVTVRFADGSSTDGSVLGADTSTDVAVVEIDPDAVIGVAQLALDNEVKVGQLAVAIGSPFGLDQTVTSGIISAVDRPYPNSEIVVGMLQTDAPINSGNSGGALVNRNGQVIGINTAIFSNSGDNSGIGFAIPVGVAHNQAQKIIKGESLDTGFLGIEGEAPPNGESGVLIQAVTDGSAAQDAGLDVGDIIVTVDGEELKDIGDLAATISTYSPGEEVELEVSRDGKVSKVSAVLGER
jgi:putative serine protease PepD